MTTDNSRKQEILIMDWFFVSKRHGESVAPLFLHYVVAQKFWSLVFCLCGVHQTMAYFVIELLSCWKGHLGKKSIGGIWKAVHLCLMLRLWRGRNYHCLERKDLHSTKLKLLFFTILFEWISASHPFSTMDFLEFLNTFH